MERLEVRGGWCYFGSWLWVDENMVWSLNRWLIAIHHLGGSYRIVVYRIVVFTERAEQWL